MSIPSNFIPMSSILTSVTAMKAQQERLKVSHQTRMDKEELEWLQPSLFDEEKGCTDFDRNRPRVSA